MAHGCLGLDRIDLEKTPADAAAKRVTLTSRAAGTTVTDGEASPFVAALTWVIGWILALPETVGLITLVTVIKINHWGGPIGYSLRFGYMVLVHWIGWKKRRGPEPLFMWSAVFGLALLFGAGRSGGWSSSDCEWGRYAEPC
jgi:hypothetical protein